MNNENLISNSERTQLIHMVPNDDILFSSDNEYGIPCLLMEMQPCGGVTLPLCAWGMSSRIKKGIATYHFYVDDYRFANIWKRPDKVLQSGCMAVVEPNFSVFDTTPKAVAIHETFRKRWLSRWFQENGLQVWVDLNVSEIHADVNMLGIPNGYNAFATRGSSDRMSALEHELQIARKISGLDQPNMLVYGGGDVVRSYCLQNNLIYISDCMTERRERKSVERWPKK